MRTAEHFLFLAALAIDEEQLHRERQYVADLYQPDEDLAVWAGSPEALIDIIAYASVFAYWLDDNGHDAFEAIQNIGATCVEEQPDLAAYWTEFTVAIDLQGNLLVGRT